MDGLPGDLCDLTRRWTEWWGGEWQIERREALDSPESLRFAVFRRPPGGKWVCQHAHVDRADIEAGRLEARLAPFAETMLRLERAADGWDECTGPTLVIPAFVQEEPSNAH